MLFCNTCGQCIYISNDCFRGSQRGIAWQSTYINAETGNIDDYGDSDTDDWEDDDEISCPDCGSNDIDTDWDGNEEEALEVRTTYEEHIKLLRIASEKAERLKEEETKRERTGWDV